MPNFRLPLFIIALVTILPGCATTGDPDASLAHDNTDATLWVQSSTEYAAATKGIYASATDALVELAAETSLPAHHMAVVLDVDETVLDNSPYQSQLIFDGESYGEVSWDRWVGLRSADAVPGVVDFLRTARSLGFHIAFITNRPCKQRPDESDSCPQKEDTRANLEAVGIETQGTSLFLMNEPPPASCRTYLTDAEQEDGLWSSDKTSRRACVSKERKIAMLFGDQLGDFVEKHDDASGREVADDYDAWGRTWFMLPNPTYGGWRPRTPEGKRELLRGID